jgi:hypothetical protein
VIENRGTVGVARLEDLHVFSRVSVSPEITLYTDCVLKLSINVCHMYKTCLPTGRAL